MTEDDNQNEVKEEVKDDVGDVSLHLLLRLQCYSTAPLL